MTSRQVRRAEARRATKEAAKGYPQAKPARSPTTGRRQTVLPAIPKRPFGESIFAKVVAAEHAHDTRLGMPSLSEAHLLRRRDVMSSMTEGRGFTVAAKTPAKDAQGMTRGDRKRQPVRAPSAFSRLPRMEDFLTDDEDKPFKRPHPLKYAALFGGAWLLASFAIYWNPWMSLSFAAGAITALVANR